MKWTKCSERLPDESGRYLTIAYCERGLHKMVFWDFPYPCCAVNISYYHLIRPGKWKFAQEIDCDPEEEVFYWSELPEKPKDGRSTYEQEQK